MFFQVIIIFLFFVLPTFTVLYLTPTDQFTCSYGYNCPTRKYPSREIEYSWCDTCNNLIPSNITVVGIQYNNITMGKYTLPKTNSYEIITCKIQKMENEKFEINEIFSGFYDIEQNYKCISKKKSDEIIKAKDVQNRRKNLFGICVLLNAFSFVSFIIFLNY
uniref:Transmembrane protein n=1 Tax=viral metagenome TaxID=1070528 RepID=A0A6C0AEK3_9ZZZZ